jgi:hypothetical protein
MQVDYEKGISSGQKIMEMKAAFKNFAPSILNVYYHNKEAFWAAVMAPFLSNETSLWDWWQHLKVDVKLLNAFKGLDDDANLTLREFSAPLGFDLTKWKSNRMQYFKDAYPVFAFLAVWMAEEGLVDLIEKFGEILQAGVFAVAGYGILDENVDGTSANPVEILTAQALIATYEVQVLRIFGVSPVNLEILHKMRTLFLEAEIKEKFMRGKGSPYRLDRPQDLGAKGANSVGPFMLSLERLGRAALIDDYWEVFLLFGAAIQMIDDWQDLEGDLAAGHFSFVTLGFEKILGSKDAKKTAKILREDKNHVRNTYNLSMEMIAKSRAILDRLDDRFLIRLVDVTELRLNKYFGTQLKISSE